MTWVSSATAGFPITHSPLSFCPPTQNYQPLSSNLARPILFPSCLLVHSLGFFSYVGILYRSTFPSYNIPSLFLSPFIECPKNVPLSHKKVNLSKKEHNIWVQHKKTNAFREFFLWDKGTFFWTPYTLPPTPAPSSPLVRMTNTKMLV